MPLTQQSIDEEIKRLESKIQFRTQQFGASWLVTDEASHLVGMKVGLRQYLDCVDFLTRNNKES